LNYTASPAERPALKHLPELDSLRTFAVLMTLLAHFAPREIPYMWYGVPIFFTISGFLITTILLNTLDNSPSVNRLGIIGNFMSRRILRLFPIYYLMILFFFLAKRYLSLQLWKDEFTPYFFTYTPNFLIHKIGAGNAGCFAHLWSLGVEEQFYLVWPWILLFCPKRFRLQVIGLLVVVALVYVTTHYTDPVIGAIPFADLHTLGAGGILGCLYVNRHSALRWLEKWRHLLFALTFGHLILVLIFFHPDSAYWHLYREISLCCCTFSVVLVSIFGWKGPIGYITRNRFIQYLGVISYGIYLYHMPVPFVYRAIAPKVSLLRAIHMSGWVFTIFCIVITIMLAAFSYRFIEMPFLRLKRYFAYSPSNKNKLEPICSTPVPQSGIFMKRKRTV
jgi:peptidoglycan/LPS O-acetylase OafA/YrhL